MPQHRNEPHIYSGSVISMIGANAGKTIEMPYKVAQGMVASGQARWEDDETPMSRQLSTEIEARTAAEEASRLADIEHNKRLKEQGAQVDDAVRDAARGLLIGRYDGGDAYIPRPLPRFTTFSLALLADPETDLLSIDGDVVRFGATNASATYKVIERTDEGVLVELDEYSQPDVEIPDVWRDRHFQTNIAAARKIRALDSSAPMTKDEAEAIIAEWVRTDDPVPTEDKGGAPTNEQGRVLDGNHLVGSVFVDEEGNAFTAEEVAKLKAKEFAEDGED